MKNILLLILLFVLNTTFAQITELPELAKRTLKGLCTAKDFSDQKTYMVNVDTLKRSNETVSGDIVYYQEKEKMVERLNSIFKVLKSDDVVHFGESKNNPYILPRKQHWVLMTNKYRIDWWFSTTDFEKLETITLVKY